MKNVRRFYIPNACYFFTVVTYQRKNLFSSEEMILRLKKSFQYTMKKYPFHLQGVVVLPDHLHCLWQLPHKDANFSIRWSTIKRYFSLGLEESVNRRREKAVWQPRFWDHFIRNEEDWQCHLDYIHYNPVKHGYVKKPLDWRWSSFKKYVERGFYDARWGEVEPSYILDFDFE